MSGLAATAAPAAGILTLGPAPAASAATGGGAASLAAVNVGRTAGTCATTPTPDPRAVGPDPAGRPCRPAAERARSR